MIVLSPQPTLSAFRFLDRARTVAGTGYNRWLVPPAALAIHLAIGQAYAFSVLNLPLTRVLGGIGLGLGYISPVSTLIKWFPDHPGMSTGLAIMGFGGGAMVGAPLAEILMDTF